MDIALWIVSGVLGLFFLFGGATRALLPPEQLVRHGLTWVTGVHPVLLKVIGVLEVLGAIGLIVPWLTGIAPVLTPIAAVCLAAVVLFGFVFHVRRREWIGIPITLIPLGLLLFVAVARFAAL